MFSQSGPHSRFVMPRRRRTDNLGDAIRARREELGWTQQHLADAVGVEELSVRNWEIGRHRPRTRHLRRLSEVLELDLITRDLRAVVTVAGQPILVTASAHPTLEGDRAIAAFAAELERLAADAGWTYLGKTTRSATTEAIPTDSFRARNLRPSVTPFRCAAPIFGARRVLRPPITP